MKMICNVPDEVIKSVRMGTWCGSSVVEKMIANGTPIPDNATVCDIDAIRREIEDLYIITNPASDPYDGGYYTALIDVRRIIDKYKGDKE